MELVPLRMLNEIAYCPRLFAIEHVMGDFMDNEHTVAGRTVHRNVDKPTRASLPAPNEDANDSEHRPKVVRSVRLSDPGLRLVGVVDLVEVDGDRVVPIDYKKGKAPKIPEGAWEPERVQVCGQALLLRAHGYHVDKAVLYFAGSRRRVEVPIDDELVDRTLVLRDQALALVASQELPPPLVDSPKCSGCSLVRICLPDEHNLLSGTQKGEPRALVPARDDAIPLHVQLQGGKAGITGGEIAVKDREGKQVARVRLNHTSQVVIHGNVTVTSPMIGRCAELDIPIAWHSFGGWYRGTMHPATGRNVVLRHRQHLTASQLDLALPIARDFIVAKIKNQRVMLRRNAKGSVKDVLMHLKDASEQASIATDPDTLRGIEGMAARRYFECFPLMIRSDLRETFKLEGRNRRPPRDPVNALLSFAYAVLVREFAHVCHRIGFDPHVGFLHTIRHGRPALALDLMEEFRPIIADSAVLSALNNGVLKLEDFDVTPVGCSIKQAARKRFLQTLERRLDELVTHPTLGSRWSYRRTLEVQTRLLGKVVMGELERYPGFVVR